VAVVSEDVSAVIDVLANDDPGLIVISVSDPGHGTAVINSDGTIAYLSDPDYHGHDAFIYTAVDALGGSVAAGVFVTVDPMNDPPAAMPDSAATNEDEAVVIDVLANDSDVESDSLTVIATTDPENGSIVLGEGGAITYTPNDNYYGADAFSYTVSDENGGESTATVSVTVNPVNDAPTAIVLSSATVIENVLGAAVGEVTVVDPDPDDTHQLAVSDDRFEIVGGTLKLKDGVSLDFESEAIVTLEISAADTASPPATLTQEFAIAVIKFTPGLVIEGTAGNDVITIRPRPGDRKYFDVLFGAEIRDSLRNDTIADILVNALEGDDRLILKPGLPHDVIFDGGGGYDRADFSAGAGAQTVAMRRGLTEMTGAGHDVTARGVEDVRVTGDASDTARLYDTNGNERFFGRSASSYMIGGDFYHDVARFGRAYGYATAGGMDRAFLYDSADSDTFYGRPTYSYLEGPGFYNYASSFDQVYAYATAGGADNALLFDSPGDEIFYGRPTYSYLEGAAFYNYASGFEKVYAYATAGGDDNALLFDSAGDDNFYGRPHVSYLTGADFYNYVSAFEKVYAYATAGGRDRAYLYDSAGDDNFYGRPNVSYLAGAGFYNYVSSFDNVYVYATAGGDDRADLYDSADNDTFAARQDYAYLYGADFYNYVKGFDRVRAIGNAGGVDRFVRIDPLTFTLIELGSWEV
jgi:hypothetical protein